LHGEGHPACGHPCDRNGRWRGRRGRLPIPKLGECVQWQGEALMRIRPRSAAQDAAEEAAGAVAAAAGNNNQQQ